MEPMGHGTKPGDPIQIAGIRVASMRAGLYYRDRPDLALFEIAAGSAIHVLTTASRAAAAPVLQVRQNLQQLAAAPTETSSYWLTNAGSANAATGAAGHEEMRRYCAHLARLAAVSQQMIWPFSTGIIGLPVNADALIAALPTLLSQLAQDGWEEASQAILTTDSRAKSARRQATWNGQQVRIAGIAKGAAMIKPDMATMLAFVATDAAVAPPLLAKIHERTVARTFNRICVEGDTSTNDCCALAATGRGGASVSGPAQEAQLEAMLGEVLMELAEAIVRDAEGATRLVRIHVNGGKDRRECQQVADALARSVLLKASLTSGSEPNWGRVLVVLGYSGPKDLDMNRVSLWLGDCKVFERGAQAAGYTDEAAAQALSGDEQRIVLDLGRGTAEDYALTCDLSEQYIRMNSQQRT